MTDRIITGGWGVYIWKPNRRIYNEWKDGYGGRRNSTKPESEPEEDGS
jgi:hypothetical protein